MQVVTLRLPQFVVAALERLAKMTGKTPRTIAREQLEGWATSVAPKRGKGKR